MVQDQHISEAQKSLETVLEQIGDPFNLIVHNDEVNTFDWVIESLMEICGHTPEQAEQCAIIIHFKGKYCVESGTETKIKPMKDALIDRGISATMEQTVQ